MCLPYFLLADLPFWDLDEVPVHHPRTDREINDQFDTIISTSMKLLGCPSDAELLETGGVEGLVKGAYLPIQ